MGIKQITLFCCDTCSRSTWEESIVFLYDAPVVTPPMQTEPGIGWDTDYNILRCPKCRERYIEEQRKRARNGE